MEIEIQLKKQVHKEMTTIMQNIKELNDNDEIGAWLLGEWTKNKNKITLTLDQLVIPKQEVSSAEVDISPESMIDTIKEIGATGSNRIKAHWHIHPFDSGTPTWSTIDDDKITDFMEPDKGRSST